MDNSNEEPAGAVKLHLNGSRLLLNVLTPVSKLDKRDTLSRNFLYFDLDSPLRNRSLYVYEAKATVCNFF